MIHSRPINHISLAEFIPQISQKTRKGYLRHLRGTCNTTFYY